MPPKNKKGKDVSIVDTIDEITSDMLTIPSEVDVFQQGIDKRNNFAQFVFENIESTINENLQEFRNKTSNSSITIVGGSRSWDQYFNRDYCNTNKKISGLSSIENAAIVPGNYDLFCFCSDSSKIDTIMYHMCISLDKIIKELNESEIGNYFELRWVVNSKSKKHKRINPIDNNYTFNVKDLKRDCPVNVESSNEGCVFPPCNALHLELKFSKLSGLPKGIKGISKKNTKEYYKLKDFDEKVLLYFEIINIDESSKNNIYKLINPKCDKNFSGFNYFNLEGLYLFSELIIQRGDKDYDVDLYRKKILDKVIEQNKMDLKTFYRNLLLIYEDIFSSRSDYLLKYNILLKKYIEVLNPNIISDYNSQIIERVRPFINAFIKDMSLDLYTYKTVQRQLPPLKISSKIKMPEYMSQEMIMKNAFMLITGGDAYRRYIPDIQKTNDIDTKIIFKNKDDEEELVHKIVYNLSALISLLYVNKEEMFNGLNIEIKNKDINIEFHPIYNSGQFRLRLIKRPDFHLFSIDYRYKLYPHFNERDSYEAPINIEVPILDVVLYHSKDYDNLQKTSVNLLGGLPIASESYLTNDLRNMYNKINDNLKRRFPKSSKDKDRFVKLITLIKEHTQPSNIKRNKRKFEELPDISMLGLQIPYPKRLKTFKKEKRRVSGLQHKLSELYMYQTSPGTLDNIIRGELYNHGILFLNDYIKKYSDLFFDTFNKQLKEDKDTEKIILQFNNISEIVPDAEVKDQTIFIEHLSIDQRDFIPRGPGSLYKYRDDISDIDSEGEDDIDTETYSDTDSDSEQMSDMDTDIKTMSESDSLVQQLSKLGF
jgi:hypothetical protein